MSSIAEGYSGDARIILNKNQTNMGLACHVNKLLHSVATGEFIALAAGDDVSTPDRFKDQLSFWSTIQ